METDPLDLAWRIGLFLPGAFIAAHHFLAAAALEKVTGRAVLLLPCSVMAGVGICWAAMNMLFRDAVYWAVPALWCVCVKDWLVWRSGAYISAALARSEELKAQQKGACP